MRESGRRHDVTPDIHKRVLEAANEAVGRGDTEGFLAYCTEDTLWEFIGDRTLRGKDAVREWMASTYLQPPRNEVQTMIAEGDSLVAVGRITTIDGSVETTSAYCDVWTFRDGRLAALRAFVV